MARCETCGNTYDKTFEVHTASGTRHVFDSFECAVEASAPRCKNCGVRIIGHGIETNETFFCCAHCAERQGVEEARIGSEA